MDCGQSGASFPGNARRVAYSSLALSFPEATVDKTLCCCGTGKYSTLSIAGALTILNKEERNHCFVKTEALGYLLLQHNLLCTD